MNSLKFSSEFIDIVAPGSAVSDKELSSSLSFVKDMGQRLDLSWTPRIFMDDSKKSTSSFCSDTATLRYQFFKKALLSEHSQIIWCLRGGYGSFHLLPFLDKMEKPLVRKILMGYSDTTALHYFLNQKWNWPSLHISGLEELSKKNALLRVDRSTKDVAQASQKNSQGQKSTEINDLIQVLQGKLLEFKGFEPLNQMALEEGQITSYMLGGNLATLVSLVGSSFFKPPQKGILFLEDVNERGYQVDRLLSQLKFARFFDNIEAVVFGNFIGGEEPDGSFQWKVAQQNLANELSIPVLRGLNCGHGVGVRPLPLYTSCDLYLGAQSSLRVGPLT